LQADNAYNPLEIPAAGSNQSPSPTLNTTYFSGLGEAHDKEQINADDLLQSPHQKKGSRVSILLKKFEDTAARAAKERENQRLQTPTDLIMSGYHDSIPTKSLPQDSTSGYHESIGGYAHESDSEELDEDRDVLFHVKGYAASDFEDLGDVPNAKKFNDNSPLTSPRVIKEQVNITTLIEEFKSRDWSAEYHSLLAQIGYEHAQPEENVEKICQLVMTLNDLAEDFLTAAEVFGFKKKSPGDVTNPFLDLCSRYHFKIVLQSRR